jgi:hypothetical protein
MAAATVLLSGVAVGVSGAPANADIVETYSPFCSGPYTTAYGTTTTYYDSYCRVIKIVYLELLASSLRKSRWSMATLAMISCGVAVHSNGFAWVFQCAT